MKRKILIITASILLLGVLLCIPFYFFYLKKAVIYDLKNIEFSGIPQDDISAIKIYGITPLNKKIAIYTYKETASHEIPGYYHSIEMVIPDTLVSKITDIHVILKEKSYVCKISDLHYRVLKGDMNTYILTSVVKSNVSFFSKWFSIFSMPFISKALNNILVIFTYFPIFLFIIFFIACVWLFMKLVIKFFKIPDKKSRQTFNDFYLPVILFLIAFCWKLFYIEIPYVWSDETGMIYNAESDLWYIFTLPAYGERHPPFFMVLIHFWIKVFGISPYSVRIIPLFFNALTAVFIYLIGKKFFSLRTGIFASGIFILSTYHFYFGMETRPYSMFSMATAASLYCFLSFINNYENRKLFIAFVLTNFLLIYSHYFSWFIVFVEFLVSFMYFHDKKLFRKLLIALVLTIVIFLPIAPAFIIQFIISSENPSWYYSPSVHGYFEQLCYFLNNIYVFICIMLIMVAGIIKNLFDKHSKKIISRELIIVFLWWFIPYTIMFFVSNIIPMIQDRYFLFNSIGFYIFIAIVLYSLYGKKLFFALTVLLLVLMFTQLKVISRHNNYSKVQNSVNYLRNMVYKNSILLIYPKNNFHHFMYYYDRNIFRNNANYDSLRFKCKKENIFPVDNIIEVKENLKKLKNGRFIYVDCSYNTGIFDYLNSNYVKTDSATYWDLFNIGVFESEKKQIK